MIKVTKTSATDKHWSVAELRKLPAHERDAILAAQAEIAEQEYRKNPELTAFEAFGKEDLCGKSSDSAAR